MVLGCLHTGRPEYKLLGCGSVSVLTVAMRFPLPSPPSPWCPYISRTDWGCCMLGKSYVIHPSGVLSFLAACRQSSLVFVPSSRKVTSQPVVADYTSTLGD
jgi:hypothetical protein